MPYRLWCLYEHRPGKCTIQIFEYTGEGTVHTTRVFIYRSAGGPASIVAYHTTKLSYKIMTSMLYDAN